MDINEHSHTDPDQLASGTLSRRLTSYGDLESEANYLRAARETVDEWKPGALINGRYLSVVKDILASAEHLAGIRRPR